jgi:pyridoxine 4-dehydrogenase
VVDIECLEIEVSLWSYEAEIREAVEYCGKHNVPILAYSPLGRGFLTRKYSKPEDIPKGSFLSHMPRFQGEAFYKNLELVDKLDEIAKEKGTSTSQLALAWLTSLNDMVRLSSQRSGQDGGNNWGPQHQLAEYQQLSE